MELEQTNECQVTPVKASAFRRFWLKIQPAVTMIAVVMVTLGQFNDARTFVVNAYRDVNIYFTHELDYEKINKINVGNSLAYIQNLYGQPQVIKTSSFDPKVSYHYYDENKYNLTVLTDGSRVLGYTLFAKQDDFAPQVPFAEALAEKSLNNTSAKPEHYYYDTNNLIYYLEEQELNQQAMYLKLMRGYVEYGAVAEYIEDKRQYRAKISDNLVKLEQAETFSSSESEVQQTISQIREALLPNVFGITELDSKFISDALQTRYEYKAYNQS